MWDAVSYFPDGVDPLAAVAAGTGTSALLHLAGCTVRGASHCVDLPTTCYAVRYGGKKKVSMLSRDKERSGQTAVTGFVHLKLGQDKEIPLGAFEGIASVVQMEKPYFAMIDISVADPAENAKAVTSAMDRVFKEHRVVNVVPYGYEELGIPALGKRLLAIMTLKGLPDYDLSEVWSGCTKVFQEEDIALDSCFMTLGSSKWKYAMHITNFRKPTKASTANDAGNPAPQAEDSAPGGEDAEHPRKKRKTKEDIAALAYKHGWLGAPSPDIPDRLRGSFEQLPNMTAAMHVHAAALAYKMPESEAEEGVLLSDIRSCAWNSHAVYTNAIPELCSTSEILCLHRNSYRDLASEVPGCEF